MTSKRKTNSRPVPAERLSSPVSSRTRRPGEGTPGAPSTRDYFRDDQPELLRSLLIRGRADLAGLSFDVMELALTAPPVGTLAMVLPEQRSRAAAGHSRGRWGRRPWPPPRARYEGLARLLAGEAAVFAM